MRITLSLLAAAALAGVWHTAEQPSAIDWPQWGGPTREFVVAAADIDWTRAGPRVVWRRPLGEGYSGIAAVGDRLYTMYREGGDEFVVALDAASGETRWTHRYPAPMLDDMNPEQGRGRRHGAAARARRPDRRAALGTAPHRGPRRHRRASWVLVEPTGVWRLDSGPSRRRRPRDRGLQRVRRPDRLARRFI
jgi:hypothetical protein